MYICDRLLERELSFTKIYRDYQFAHKAERELAVLTQQIPNYFVCPKESDLIAGRIDRPLVVVSPCLEGDNLDKVGYGIDEQGCMDLLYMIEQDSSYSQEYADRVRDMIMFWKKENTNTKIRNRIPDKYAAALYTDDYNNASSAIHPIYRLAGVNLDFEKLYKYGLTGLIDLIQKKKDSVDDVDKQKLYSSMIGTINLLKIVIGQYVDDIQQQLDQPLDLTQKRTNELKKMKTSLENLLENPPQNFREALQLQTIYMLSGRAVEIGRLDDYMCTIYHKSLEEGTVTREEAILLLDNFFTIIEEERGRDTRAIIGGVGRKNPKLADEFSMLVLDVLELRKYHFYPQVSLRYYKGMDERIYNKTLELLSQGYTFPMLYNDDVNVASVMRAMDVPRKMAEQYSFFGCGEYILAKDSIGTPNTALNVAKVLEITLHNGHDPETGMQWGPETGYFTNDTTFDELKNRYKKQLDFFCDASGSLEELVYDVCNEECSMLLMSILLDNCIESGKGFLDGGICHLGGTVETYGNVTAYDSLTAIKDVIYDKNLLTPEKLLEALRSNFIGFETEQLLLRRAAKFGNDNTLADGIASELHEYICKSIRRQNKRTRLDSFLVVIINNSMNVVLGRYVGATPDGRMSEEFLSNGNSAYTGCDKQGLTALLNSMAKLDTSIHAGGNQNIKLSVEFFTQNSFSTVKSIISTFFDMGGQQINLSVVNQQDLEEAMINPEKYENLVVRVGGFSARFVNLEPDVQKDILSRTSY